MTAPYYQDDLVTLHFGDSREIDGWLAADVLVTDPPYGRAWKQGNIKEARWLRAQDSDAHAGIANDTDTAVRDAALEAWGDRPWIAFGDLMLAPPAGTKLTGVYWKDSGTSGFRGAVGGVRRDVEAIYFGGKHASGLGGRSAVFPFRGSVSGSRGLTGLTGHPHTKPTGRASWLPEPAMGRVARGVSRGVGEAELHALGNAVVPPIFEHIGRRVIEHARLREKAAA